MLDGVVTSLPQIAVTESSYVDTVGGEDGDNGDIFSNATRSNLSDDKFIEAKFEYENLLDSFKRLFGLFKTKTDKDSGIKIKTNTKIFDRFDYKLFKLAYGLEFKREGVKGAATSMNNLYSQEEIGKIMWEFEKSFGSIREKPYSQEAISARIKVLNEKIKAAIEEYPSLKASFEYIYNYFLANSEEMQLLSNSREEMEIKLEREELSEIYADNSQEINKTLADGKRLADNYQVSQSNPFDDAMAETFNIL